MGEWPEARLDTTRAKLAGEIWLLAVAILLELEVLLRKAFVVSV